MPNGGTDRPVTRAQRAFGADDLAHMPWDDLRQLCHALFLAEGAVPIEYRQTAEYGDFVLPTRSLWGSRETVVRLLNRPGVEDDLRELVEHASAHDADEAILVLARGASDRIASTAGTRVISSDELSRRIIQSPLVEWDGDHPTASMERLEFYLELANTTALIDPIGIRWLPSLAFNELPPTLGDMEVEPQDLLEQKTFRLLTASLRFGGVRYGEARRGERLPDSVIDWSDESTISAIVDCKAASSGYRMDADHFLRFRTYWERLGPEWQARGREIQYLVIVSSYFPGREGDRHPIHNRQQELLEETGLKLCYLTASDLAQVAAQLESEEVPLDVRAQIRWQHAFDQGLVQSEHLLEVVAEAMH